MHNLKVSIVIPAYNASKMGQNAAKFAKENFDSDVLCEKILERKKMLLG